RRGAARAAEARRLQRRSRRRLALARAVAARAAPQSDQNPSRTPSCSCRGSSAAVGRPYDGSGVVPGPNTLFGVRRFVRLSTLKPSAIASSVTRPRSGARHESRRSSVLLPHARALLRPTPSGRSFTFVSLLRSVPVTGVNGGADAAVNTYDRLSGASGAAIESRPTKPLRTSRCRTSLSDGPQSARTSKLSWGELKKKFPASSSDRPNV